MCHRTDAGHRAGRVIALVRTPINFTTHAFVTHTPLPGVPLAAHGQSIPLARQLPCIHPADGAIYALGVLHRGARAAVEFAGSAGTSVGGEGPALLKPIIEIDGAVQDLSAGTMVWERAAAWLPTFRVCACCEDVHRAARDDLRAYGA